MIKITDVLEQKGKAVKLLVFCAKDLHGLSESFRSTGNLIMGDRLERRGNDLYTISEEIDEAFTRMLNESVAQAQQASGNMLSLALALGESKKRGTPWKDLLENMIDAFEDPFDNESCYFCNGQFDTHDDGCAWEAAVAALAEAT